jgi:small subunit ribosomal protein S2
MAMDEKTPVVPATDPAPSAPTAETAQAAEPIILTEDVSLRDLLDAGLHFGHQTKRWNPKMRPFIFDKRSGIHVIDLTQSLSQLQKAQAFLANMVGAGRGILFVGTKKQAQTTVREVAKMCGQYSVTSRWLGGTLTNNRTVRNSIKRMRTLEKMEKDGEFEKLPKKEVAVLRHELAKLQKNLTGIADMEQLPGAMVIVDINREANAVKEAITLHIPVVAIVDTCCDPDPVDYPIPGNDDAIRAIRVVISALGASIVRANGEWEKRAGDIKRQREADGLPPVDFRPRGEPKERPRRERRPGGDRNDRPSAGMRGGPRGPRREKKDQAPAAPAAPAAPEGDAKPA